MKQVILISRPVMLVQKGACLSPGVTRINIKQKDLKRRHSSCGSMLDGLFENYDVDALPF